MIINWVKRAYNAVLHPEVRLKADFPWGFGKMATTYILASLIYLLGSIMPLFVFVAFLAIAARVDPQWLGTIIIEPGTRNDPNMMLVVLVVVASFITGFGAELLYIRSVFHRDGLSLRKAVGFNLDSLHGSWWSAIWRSLLAFGVVIVLNNLMDYLPLPKVHDPAADFAAHLSNAGFFLFGLLAVVAAPLFEELVFRGFLFNVCRTSFRQGWFAKVMRTERLADYAAMAVSAAVFAGAHMTLTGFPALFLMGVVLAALYRRSGSLICPMMLHALNNLLGFVLLWHAR
jgi:membrane protease YdiL (CAAX protease family)